ncbi:hypothetical protein [Burkholderia ubonensis]|uniref:hypothetical protein n=1 Tax=Burkholderia ubonensis TaxID=101571 RepID=UPI00075281D9|nr:hypothetical protein [Burkholderia ubonensis]KWN10831.1 hypothetical protein WM21_23235 [Burkholderia ubonensis]
MNEMLFRELDRRARDFLVAVDSTMRTDRALPPARAARVGLIPAWRAWVDALRRRDGEVPAGFTLCADSDYGPPQAGEALTQLLVEATRVHNPARHERLQQWEVQKLATLGMAAGLYLARPHAVIEPTAALQHWLVRTDIGSDIPASLFRLPMPAVFVRFGAEMAEAVDAALWAHIDTPVTTIGVYVFDTRVGSRRDLVFIPIGVKATPRPDQCDLPVIVQLIFTEERDPLMARVASTSSGEGRLEAEDLKPAMEMCIKVMLYLQTAGAVRSDEMRGDDTMARLTRVGNRKVSRIERQLASRYNRIIVGPARIEQHAGGEISPHWRRGHLRMQPHGPQNSLRKLIFIAPTLIRADRLGHDAHADNGRLA